MHRLTELGQGSLGQAVLQGAFPACSAVPVPQHRAAVCR